MTGLLAVLILLDVEGLACMLWAVLTPSEGGSEVFLWLSPARLALTVFLLAVWLASMAATIRIWRSRSRADAFLGRLDEWCMTKRRLGAALIVLIVLPLLGLCAASGVLSTPREYAAYRVWAPETFPLLYSAVRAALPLLVFGAGVLIQSAIFLALRYRRSLVKRETWYWGVIAPALMGLLILTSVLVHWAILVFRLRFFVNIPAWYWIFDPLPFTDRDLWFLLGALVLLALACWALVARYRLQIGLPAVFLLALFLQLGVGIMGGGGLDTLRERYFTTYHQSYVARAAGSHQSILENIRRYEELHGPGRFTSTKPPGLMAFYIGLEHVVNGFPSSFDDARRYQRLSDVIVWLFPLLAAAAVLCLYAFTQRFLAGGSGRLSVTAALLYVLAPSVALFTFFADQAIYPAVFLFGVWLAVAAIRRQSFGWAFLLGALLYCAAFFAFTMLPLYVFAGLYLGFYYWRHRSGLALGKILGMALAIAAGTLALHFLFLRLLNYDVVARFQRTMAINHNFDFYLRVGRQSLGHAEPFALRVAQIANAAWINNLDFAAAIGFPIYILFIAQAVRRISRLIKGSRGAGDFILLALLLSFLVLNLAGTAQGEVPRLWLFWLPMVAIFAALELQPVTRDRPAVLFALGTVQLITLMLTFHFQDLRM